MSPEHWKDLWQLIWSYWAVKQDAFVQCEHDDAVSMTFRVDPPRTS